MRARFRLIAGVAVALLCVATMDASGAVDGRLDARGLHALASAALRARGFATAESLLATLPVDMDSTSRLEGEQFETELLRMEARAVAPGHCDWSWLWRPSRITNSLAHATREQAARAWIARTAIETRFGLAREAALSSKLAVEHASRCRSRKDRDPLILAARLARAEAFVLGDADTTAFEVGLAEPLLESLAEPQRRLQRPRLLRLKGEAVFWKTSLDSAVRLLEQAHALALRDLPPRDPECGRSLVFLGIAENQLLRHDAGNRHRREAATTLIEDVGLVDERSCEAYTIYSWTQRSPRQARAVIEELEDARRAMASAGFGESIGAAWLDFGLARAHFVLGRPDSALRLYQRTLARQIRWHGPWHAEVGQGHLEMANVLSATHPETALAHAFAAKAIYDSIGDRSVTFRLILRSTLGDLLGKAGRRSEARAMLEQNLQDYVRLRGRTHWETAETASALASLCWGMGDYRAADTLFALSVAAADFGGTASTGFVWSHVVRRARFHLARGRIDSLATSALPRASAMSIGLEESLPWVLDDEGIHVATTVRNLTNVLLSGLIDAQALPDGFRQGVFELAVRSRGLLLESWLARARGIGQAARINAISYDERARLRRQLAGLVLSAYGQPGTARQQARRDSLRTEIRRLERGPLEPDAAPPSLPSTAALLARVPEGSALVSYLRHPDLRDVGPGLLRNIRAPQRVVAFVLRSASNGPEYVDLGAGESLDSLLSVFLSASPSSSLAMARARDSLSTLLWAPLESHLAGVRRVLIVTDGSLDRLPFATLRARNRKLLIEQDVVLHRLGHERDLLGFGESAEPMRTALLVGGVDFDAARPQRATHGPALRSAPACRELLDKPFLPLAASLEEVRGIQSVLGRHTRINVELAIGADATEGLLKSRVSAPSILHLATHGFSLDPACSEDDAEASLVQQDPLVFSGLVLSGANQAKAARERGDEDGLLTAEELAGMDLRSTRLLVLSGCQSAVGQLKVEGEGLFGLPRAARTAGARTTLMSAWPVDDDATAFWMTEFYKAHFQGRQDLALAVRTASRATLARLRRLGLDPSPRLWGAFLAVGDWR